MKVWHTLLLYSTCGHSPVAGNPSVVFEKDVIISSGNYATGTTVGIFLSGMPTPAPVNVTWLFNGAMLGPPGVVLDDRILRFNAFVLIHDGVYTCIVNTSAGLGMDNLRVQIRGMKVF